MYKIATPVSHLFRSDFNAKLLMELSDCLEIRDNSPNVYCEKQHLYHCNLQPIHEWKDEDYNYLKEIKETRKSLKLISFHLASCFDRPSIRNNVFFPGGRKYNELEMFGYAKHNFKKVKEIFGPEILIAVENNNFYDTPAYNIVCDTYFIKKIVEDNEIFFLFDLAHAHISSYNKGISFESYCDELPLDRVLQFHICKSSIINGVACDTHNLPDETIFKELEQLIERCKNVKYFTVEFYKDSMQLSNALIVLRNLLESYY